MGRGGGVTSGSGPSVTQALERAARGSHGHPLPITGPHCCPWCFRPPVGLPLLAPVGLLVALMRAASPHRRTPKLGPWWSCDAFQTNTTSSCFVMAQTRLPDAPRWVESGQPLGLEGLLQP